MGQKILGLKVTLTIDLTISIVGVLTFSSIMMVVNQNFTTMMKKLISIVVGVALVGRTVPNSVL